MDEAKSGGLTGGSVPESEFLAAHSHARARLGDVVAGEHLDEGRLATAVLAHQSPDFAGRHIDADVVERGRAAENLRCVANRQCRRHAASLWTTKQ